MHSPYSCVDFLFIIYIIHVLNTTNIPCLFCMEKKNPFWLVCFSFPHTVHSRSSPADTSTPPNQKSRVKKKVSKSSAYRRDAPGGEWRSLQGQGNDDIYILSFSIADIFSNSVSVIEHSEWFTIRDAGIILCERDSDTGVGHHLFSVAEHAALLQKRKSCSWLFPVNIHCCLSVSE